MAAVTDKKIREALLDLGRSRRASEEHLKTFGNDSWKLTNDELAGVCTDDACKCNGYVNKAAACKKVRASWEHVFRLRDEAVRELMLIGSALLREDDKAREEVELIVAVQLSSEPVPGLVELGLGTREEPWMKVPACCPPTLVEPRPLVDTSCVVEEEEEEA